MKHKTIFSGIQPSGNPTLGNYLGALRNWVSDQANAECLFSIVDLHAITVDQDPLRLRKGILDVAALLLAIGIDPEESILFAQSQVPQHTQLGWIMESTVTFGELSRMTQFKDKGRGSSTIRASLFTYPALMAADILLYQSTHVPVGDDQRQHLELTRDLAIRFNNRFGEIFLVPEPEISKFGGRIMDLQNPSQKMSKSSQHHGGNIYILEPPEELSKKIMRAVTDTEGKVYFDPENPAKAGVNNLLEIFSIISATSPEVLAEKYTGYGSLKKDLAEALIVHLTPIQNSYKEIRQDEQHLVDVLSTGAEKAQRLAEKTLHQAMDAVGFI